MSSATGIATPASSAVSSPSTEQTGRLRLTRRGRVVFTTLIAAPIALVAGAMILSGGMATASGDVGAEQTFVQVASGESLWELAAGLAPEADPREVVSDLVHFNQLDSADVQPGQKLAVPAAYAD